MSKNIEKNIWKKNGLAPLDYCSISRAANILNCEESDILHWCYTGKINLGINLRSSYLYYISFRKESGSVASQIESLNTTSELNADGGYRFYSDKTMLGYFYIPRNPHIIETDNFYLARVIASGYWPIENFVLEDTDYGKLNTKDLVLYIENNPDFKAENRIPYGIISPTLVKKHFSGILGNISKEDMEQLNTLCEHAPDINTKMYELQITGYYIEYIYKYALSGNRIPVIERAFDAKRLASHDGEEISTVRTTAKQSSYIAALMNALGVSEEMMRFGSISQMREHLSRRAGEDIYLPDITDDTLDDWLKRAGKR